MLMMMINQYCGIGTAAAMIQRRFWGASVKEGSWFSYLQRAGMKGVPPGAGKKVIGGISAGIGMGASLLGC